MDNLKAKKRHPEEIAVYSAIYVCAAFSVLLLLGIIVYVFAKGARRVNWAFLTGVTSILHGTVGIAGNILNTLIIILLTMIITTPIGAGIPSIIFGLFGMLFFGQLCHMGYSLLTGSLTLTLMVLPLVTRNTQEALKTVPDSFRTGAVGLGAGKWYTIRTILLPSAMPGIVTGVILAIGRIIGESAALLFTAGSAHLLPKTFDAFLEKIFHSGGTLTIQLYLSASKGEFEVAFGIAVVLLVIVLLINFGTKRLAKKLEKH